MGIANEIYLRGANDLKPRTPHMLTGIIVDPIVKTKLGYAAGAVCGCLFILLGIYTLSSIFSSALNSGPVWQSNVNLRYVFAAIGGLFLGAVLLLMTIPVFIPIKHKIWHAPKMCPRCGALANRNAEVCGKCDQQLELDPTKAAQADYALQDTETV